ncbi:MAG: pseudaminic acid cytidylyltransferase, partial [Paracoccaceae bacterium]
MNTLGIIPARAGSKRLPRKNIKLVNGTRPLLCWTIAAALASKRVNKVIISTDCPEIMKIAESEGCEVPFQRPEYLARDDT